MIEPTLTATMVDHLTPEDEPPIGTMASFLYLMASGGDSTIGYMLRDAGGWRENPNQPARSWSHGCAGAPRPTSAGPRPPTTFATPTATD